MPDDISLENPYLSARKEYGDRYGSAVKDAARWRQISIFMVMLCLAFGAVMMWLASQNKVVPYIVQVDKHGYAVAIKSAQEGAIADTRVIVAALGGFFVNFKTVITDVASQRRMVNDVYSYLAKNSSAETAVSQYYKEHNPFIATQDKREYTVQVALSSVQAVMINLGRSYGQKKKLIRAQLSNAPTGALLYPSLFLQFANLKKS